jgi:hypothetical protein
MTIEVQDCPEKNLPYIDLGDGVKRYLASIPAPGKMKAALPNYGDASQPMYDRKDWFELSRRGAGAVFDTIFNQGSHGSCVGNGWAGGLGRARALAGATPFVLSPAFTYSLINGNRDNGAVISDGIAALQHYGTCLFSTVGQDPIYQSRMPAVAGVEAKRFRLGQAYHCSNWDQVISAVLSGRFIPVYGYQVGRNFNSFDRYGVAGHDRGPGNHCNHADGVKLLADGRWVLDDVNSWGTSFGDGGRCYLDEQHLFGGGDEADVCVIQAFVEDSSEANEPPKAQ